MGTHRLKILSKMFIDKLQPQVELQNKDPVGLGDPLNWLKLDTSVNVINFLDGILAFCAFFIFLFLVYLFGRWFLQETTVKAKNKIDFHDSQPEMIIIN